MHNSVAVNILATVLFVGNVALVTLFFQVDSTTPKKDSKRKSGSTAARDNRSKKGLVLSCSGYVCIFFFLGWAVIGF